MYIFVTGDCIADQWEGFNWYVWVGVGVGMCARNKSKCLDAFE